ncbi:hypothetical protein BHM03_00029940 [Ensete ventricosum]|nr:hypothetical protein BHM03_00029940 [Ensete ventricosum]
MPCNLPLYGGRATGGCRSCEMALAAPTGCFLCWRSPLAGWPWPRPGRGWPTLHGGWPWLAAPPPCCLRWENTARTRRTILRDTIS